ncbi:LOW QUALITY PROTEIN: dynein axonemal assembly factor 11-like [Lethenteron reissneri]|uniref:LOW QUALITY PROTEIN: dynein axonemal assembly factor 11-like n=1 Tax=Lethenteron reissneri TaxID=7753 RepID=UPI002AB62D00|nr:LOW QUALITY PROTEIN: dynein axonemal assembly factor 11-like [Lethenteron reissneri]
MVLITEALVRSRAEHNNGELFSLEELSLHQQQIERLQHLDVWCRHLKTLYLHNNVIPRIENLSRLKELEYLNLALNNVERIENLQGCESLQKLDLTVNFVGELSSVETLRHNPLLEELFLVGNPCADFEGYRPYVVATLPQLKHLDGQEIERSERIRAHQELEWTRRRVLEQEAEYLPRRAQQKLSYAGQENDDETRRHDSNGSVESNQRFWEEETEFTPESRMETHRHLEESRKAREGNRGDTKQPKRERTLITADGRVLNVNEAKLDFSLTENDADSTLVLDLAVYKYLDTSLIDVDVQPNYARVTVKGKVFQLVLPEEVQPDRSLAQRSQTTGHMLLTMPKVKEVVKPEVVKPKPCVKNHPKEECTSLTTSNRGDSSQGSAHQHLEVDPSARRGIDVATIVRDAGRGASGTGSPSQPPPRPVALPAEGPAFVDDPDVPPLI